MQMFTGGRSKVMQACGQITVFAIVAAVMSIDVICWLKDKKSSPLLPVGDTSTSAVKKEVDVHNW